MKKIIIYLIAFMAFIACRKANIVEIKPFSENFTDSTKTLVVKDKYPCMELVTDKAIHLPVTENEMEDEMEIKTNIHYLPLETTEECLIGQIDKLESDDSCIFIFDRTNQAILRFSQKDGSFLNKFGSQGRGPGEFIGITDMSLNKQKKEICLIDFSLFKLMFYTYNGDLIREEPLYYVYNQIAFLGDRIVLHTEFNENTMAPSVNNNRLVLAEADQEPLYVGFAFPEGFEDNFSQGSNAFTTCDGKVYYNHVLSDTIWQIKENGICEAKYIFKFPGRNNLFNEEDFKKITDERYQKKIENKPYFRDAFLITKNFIKANIVNAQNLLYCIPTGHCSNNMTYKTFGKPTSLHSTEFTLNDNSFVRVLQPFDILKEIQFYQNHFNDTQYTQFLNMQLTEEERQLLSNMTEEDNPILMIMGIEPF